MRFRSMIATVLFSALAAASAYAQSSEAMRVTVPFDFTVHKTAMPAGTYTIHRADGNDGGLMLMRNSGGSAVLFQGRSAVLAPPAERSSLAFRHEESGYVLTDIRWAGFTTGVDLPERGVKEQATASSLPQSELVVIAAR
jgi:hypothetical protein